MPDPAPRLSDEGLEELIERLRIAAQAGSHDGLIDVLPHWLTEAADALAALKGERDEARQALANHELHLPDIVQERIEEINAEAEAFDRDAIKALTFILKHHCGEAGAELLSDQDGWSTDQAIECVAEEFRRITAAESERDEARVEVARLGKLVYVPGLWRCAKCNFKLLQSNLNMGDGTVTARDTPGDKCPNCEGPLWRVTERDAGNDMVDRCEDAVLELSRVRKILAGSDADSVPNDYPLEKMAGDRMADLAAAESRLASLAGEVETVAMEIATSVRATIVSDHEIPEWINATIDGLERARLQDAISQALRARDEAGKAERDRLEKFMQFVWRHVDDKRMLDNEVRSIIAYHPVLTDARAALTARKGADHAE